MTRTVVELHVDPSQAPLSIILPDAGEMVTRVVAEALDTALRMTQVSRSQRAWAMFDHLADVYSSWGELPQLTTGHIRGEGSKINIDFTGGSVIVVEGKRAKTFPSRRWARRWSK